MIGFQILQRQRVIDPSVVKAFKDLPVACVSDCMQRMFAGGPDLRPMHNGHPMAGAAFTVKVRPGDNLMVHKAIQLAGPGDVLVVDGGGDLTNALIGEIMTSAAHAKGIVGMVIYGSVRDAGYLKTQDFGVFACGVTHRGPYKDGPGEINVPLALGGMVIHPGDLILGDEDGVLCVPIDHASALLKDTQLRVVQETAILEQIRSGTYQNAWIDKAVKDKMG
jgi:RraA family protein